VSQIQEQVNAGSACANGLQQLIACVLRHWICRRSIGPERLGVLDNHSHAATNLLETYQSAVRRRIKVSRPNLNLNVPWPHAARYMKLQTHR